MKAFLPALLLATFLACAPLTRPAVQQAAEPVALEIYLIHDTPQPGLVERTADRTNEVILVAPTPDLTARDIAWAAPLTDRIAGRPPQIVAHFTPVGMDKLATLTQTNVYRRLAIVLDGRIIATPLIKGKITDGRITIQGFASSEEAQRVAAGLSRR